MNEKQFIVENDNNEVSIKDKVKDNYPFALAYEHIDDADNLIQECLSLVGLLNEQQNIINKQNELIKLIANACTYSKEHSVKEILRKEIKGIDTVTYESAGAWHDYVLLSEFFERHYKEHWDNE